MIKKFHAMYSEAMIIKKLIYLYIEDSKKWYEHFRYFLYSYVFLRQSSIRLVCWHILPKGNIKIICAANKATINAIILYNELCINNRIVLSFTLLNVLCIC